MDLEKRITSFIRLGEKISTLAPDEFSYIISAGKQKNAWFTEESIRNAFAGISIYLSEKNLRKWISEYDLSSSNDLKVGVIMAGNIPLAGFHDFLSVLISGNKIHIKLSSDDTFLPQQIARYLIEIEPEFEPQVVFAERLNTVEAIIATGSDNSFRYFNYYFAKVPHLFRKNRNSSAVIDGNENNEDFLRLGEDIFTYYGLGCRNVSKLYVPKDYNFNFFFESIEVYRTAIDHHKYAHNYDYNKSIFLVNKVTHFDNGFLLLKEDRQLPSPVSVINYEMYNTLNDLELRISEEKENTQCIVSKSGWVKGSIPFGNAQKPDLWDYADGIDTLKFLIELK